MAERAGEPKNLDLGKVLDPKKYDFELKSPERREETLSRLRREESEAEYRLRSQEAEDIHRRRISLIVHIFVMSVVTVAFGASVYIVVVKEPQSGLPDKAMGIITAIVAAGVGYMTGKSSQ